MAKQDMTFEAAVMALHDGLPEGVEFSLSRRVDGGARQLVGSGTFDLNLWLAQDEYNRTSSKRLSVQIQRHWTDISNTIDQVVAIANVGTWKLEVPF